MKEFLNKHKKVLTILLVFLLLLGVSAIVYFFILDTKPEELPEESEITETQEDVSPLPEFVMDSSTKAIEITYEQAKDWSDDVELYNCSGLPTSIQFEDVTYNSVGAEKGSYHRWMCTYYSPSKSATKVYVYVGGELEPDREAIDIGEFGEIMYDSIDYPSDLSSIVDSTEVYARALEEGLDDEVYYVNMYLSNVMDFGYVWEIEERNRTDLDEYEIGKIVNTYIFDIYTGELKEKTQEEVF
jgi:hypothetical protein